MSDPALAKLKTPSMKPEAVSPERTIVLHPGSSTLRYGLASDTLPEIIPHIIARRYRMPVDIKTNNTKEYDAASESREAIMRELETAESLFLKRDTTTKPTKRRRDGFGPAPGELMDDVDDLGFEWTELIPGKEPPFLVGTDALRIPPEAESQYRLRQPMRRGYLSPVDYHSFQELLADLLAIWLYVVREKMEIRNLSEYCVVLLISDLFERRDLKEMVNLLLKEMGFRAVFVLQESVASAVAAGYPTACVVDMGDEKTSIACIDEGLSFMDSRINMPYGGRDIERFLLWLITRNSSFAHRQCDLSHPRDRMIIREMKETLCHLTPGVWLENYEFKLYYGRGKTMKRGLVSLSDALIKAPMALFYPGVLEPLLPPLMTWPTRYDTDDIFDESYHHEVARRTRPPPEGDMEMGEFDSRNPQPIDAAIISSIHRTGRKEVMKKLFGAIFLVGSGAQIPGLKELLEVKLNERLKQPDIQIVINGPSETVHLAWRGGTFVPMIEGMRDLWIQKEEWEQFGTRVLREKIPFVY